MDTQHKILETAGEMFMRCGLRSVSIDDICNRIHISKKTFYMHFRSKEELIEALLGSMRKQREAQVAVTNRSSNAIDIAMHEISEARTNNANDLFYNFFYDLRKYYPDIEARHESAMRQVMFDHFCRGLRKGIEEGYFRDDLNVEATVVLMHSHILTTITDLRNYTKMSPTEITIFIADSFLRLITSAKGWEYYQQNKNKIK
ncbi:MAG: TetR/AcrR family transcriptional regulator [Paludibacteraceae bacterium]|nr:TetR/AcrR family transcriptional regulator [Paludibacteraceae bacterium]MDY4851115.1 TetR/AcrR family transcriptional regulator [Paludibacteraceae bacterium]